MVIKPSGWRITLLALGTILIVVLVLRIGFYLYTRIEQPRVDALTVAQDEKLSNDDDLQGDYAGAYSAASQCISLNDTDFKCWMARGLAEYKAGKCDLAKTDFTQAATLASSSEQIKMSIQTYALLTMPNNNCASSSPK